MSLHGQAQRLTIYIGSSDTWHGRNLALAIVEKCRSEGIAGATVSRGLMGFGKQSRVHKAHLLGLSIVPEMCAEADDSIRRVYRPIARTPARRSIVAAWHPGRHRPRLAERFLEGLREECRGREGKRE